MNDYYDFDPEHNIDYGIHVLFTQKTSFIYSHFLNWLVIRYGINNIHWEIIMMDNEQAMITSLHDNIP